MFFLVASCTDGHVPEKTRKNFCVRMGVEKEKN